MYFVWYAESRTAVLAPTVDWVIWSKRLKQRTCSAGGNAGLSEIEIMGLV